MRSFTSLTSYVIRDRGTVYAVRLDREQRDFSDIIGTDVLIDGAPHTVRAVERFAHTPPWRVGEEIGLLVAPET